MSVITTRILNGFNDESFGEKEWTKLLNTMTIETVNMTWVWQRNWWNHFGKGRLLLIVAEEKGTPIALAPLFADGGMIFNICPEDILDFIGDISNEEVLGALLQAASGAIEGFSGFRFYFISNGSETGGQLKKVAAQWGWICCLENEIPSPALDIRSDPANAVAATRKKSLVRHENYFKREGRLEIFHFKDQKNIEEYLPVFFEQHIKRRAVTEAKSIFVDPKQQQYYYDITRNISSTGWLRFTCVKWNNQPIAFHYGFFYKGRFLYGIPSFDLDLERHSPGEVLLRQVLLAAIGEGADIFDFGIGDEEYKYRFATSVPNLITWALYPSIN